MIQFNNIKESSCCKVIFSRPWEKYRECEESSKHYPE